MKNYLKVLIIPLFCFILTAATFKGIDLEIKSLLDNQVELKIPKAFKLMDDKMRNFKYPTGKGPKTIYTDEDAAINIALDIRPVKVSQEAIPKLLPDLVKSFKTKLPDAEWLANGVKTVNGQKIVYFKMITNAIDTKVYNYMIYTSVKGNLLICTFNFTVEHRSEWEPVAEEIMNSFKIKK